MKKFAVIVAGGSGSRMGDNIPKQFLELARRPILMHTIETFFNFDKTIQIIVVLPDSQIVKWEKLCDKHKFNIKHKIASGGNTRFHSVKNGIKLVDDDGIVFIHDGVRPFLTKNTIASCLKTAIEKGNAIPVLPVTESIRKGNFENSSAVNRDSHFLVQTPQTFSCNLIKEAFEQDYQEQFTDEASVVEAFGEKVYLVEGNRENIKITYPEDLKLGSLFLE